MKIASEERRTHPRTHCSNGTVLASRDHENWMPVVNMSTGGVLIKTESPLPVGKKISLFFSLYESKLPSKFDGEIVWSNDYGSGVRFNWQPAEANN
ncbi:MAG: PilZ domain-containing protein [Desulfobacterales bacterium]|nr:PilZ domain-containing protein [Desulfobacterales bacterium]